MVNAILVGALGFGVLRDYDATLVFISQKSQNHISQNLPNK